MYVVLSSITIQRRNNQYKISYTMPISYEYNHKLSSFLLSYQLYQVIQWNSFWTCEFTAHCCEAVKSKTAILKTSARGDNNFLEIINAHLNHSKINVMPNSNTFIIITFILISCASPSNIFRIYFLHPFNDSIVVPRLSAYIKDFPIYLSLCVFFLVVLMIN